MSIWNKILVGLIGIAALVFFHAATRTVKTYKYWCDKTVAFEKALAAKKADNVSLLTADYEHPREDKTLGLQQLRLELGRVLANRGRVWAGCQKQKAAVVNPGLTVVNVSSDEGGITPGMVVYAFEDGDDQSPGKYLGEFRVNQVDANTKQVQLASTTQLVTALAKNVAESKTWVLYEMMPADEYEAFIKKGPEDIPKFVPDEFVKSGQVLEGLSDHELKDVLELVAQGKPDAVGKKLRPLRDYQAVFRNCEIHRTLFADRWESITRDKQYLTTANEEVLKNQEAAEKEKTQVATERDRSQKELNAVNAHVAALQRMLDFNQAAVKQAIDANARYANEIARLQKEAADAIDRRTRSMAQTGPGTN
jgi:hypothetical protein